MNKLTSLIGDGEGNLSTMRFLVVFVALALVASKFYNSYLTKQPVVFDGTDLTILGSLIGGKLIQNTQEKPTPETAQPQKDKQT